LIWKPFIGFTSQGGSMNTLPTPSRLSLSGLAVAAVLAVAPVAAAAVDVTVAEQEVTITVPSRLSIAIDNATLAMQVDPADSGTHAVYNSAATVTVKSNTTGTTLAISATQPTAGANTIAFSNFEYKVATVAKGTATSTTTGSGADWTPFTTTPALALTITGRTDSTTATYDYRVARSWQYASGDYTTRVTYTIAAL
jgi:hypothetical protein